MTDSIRLKSTPEYNDNVKLLEKIDLNMGEWVVSAIRWARVDDKENTSLLVADDTLIMCLLVVTSAGRVLQVSV